MKDFSGRIELYDLQGKSLGKSTVFEGKPVQNKATVAVTECIYDFYISTQLYGYTRYTYKLKSCSTTIYGDPGTTYNDYMDSSNYVGSSWNIGYAEDGSVINGSGGGNDDDDDDIDSPPLLPMEPRDDEEEDKIDYSELEGKAKCVYEKLKSSELFQNTIGVFDNNDDYLLKIQPGYCDTGNEACTNGADIENGNVIIKIQTADISLDLAATMLHEGIHAEIYKYVHEYNTGVDPTERRSLLNYYYQYGAQNGLDLATTRAQHQYMADNYVKPIARAIRELDENRFPLENYMGFGWDGLRAYGYNGYYDNGTLIRLDKSVDTDYYKNQAQILATTQFNNDCTEE